MPVGRAAGTASGSVSPAFGSLVTDANSALQFLVGEIGASGDVSAESRAAQIESQLNRLLERVLQTIEPVIGRSPGDPASRTITVSRVVVMTVTSDDAAANGVDVARWLSGGAHP
jgi:hypothetical protein